MKLTRAWRRPEPTVRRSVMALVVTALLAFSVVATGAVIVAGHIAERDALDEAVRSAHVVGNTVFVPFLPDAILGKASAIHALDEAVKIRSKDGSLVRIKVWRHDGTVIYANDPSVIGKRFPLNADIAHTIDQQVSTADVSNLSDPENFAEKQYKRLVEVYIPITLDDGTRLAFELYTSDARVVAAKRQLTGQLVPFALLALLVLVISQLPVSVWLVRRVGRAQEERARLLRNSLNASARERRAIARDLHDGVVQDLAGAGYALGALSRTLPEDTPPATVAMVDRLSGVLQGTVGSLRTLMVDIYPPDLTADGLEAAMNDLADKLRDTADVEVSVDVDLPNEPSPEVAGAVYRCARECLVNVAKHARARTTSISLTGDSERIRLLLKDDGVGLGGASLDRRDEGHVGLPLLRDAAEDLGGALRVTSESGQGTLVDLDLPLAGIFATR